MSSVSMGKSGEGLLYFDREAREINRVLGTFEMKSENREVSRRLGNREQASEDSPGHMFFYTDCGFLPIYAYVVIIPRLSRWICVVVICRLRLSSP